MALWPFGKKTVTQTFELRGQPRPAARADVDPALLTDLG
jgi:hypothetical protein